MLGSKQRAFCITGGFEHLQSLKLKRSVLIELNYKCMFLDFAVSISYGQTWGYTWKVAHLSGSTCVLNNSHRHFFVSIWFPDMFFDGFMKAKRSKSRDFIAIEICGSNCESQITSGIETVRTIGAKLNVLTCWTGNWRCDSDGDLNRGFNHQSSELKVQFDDSSCLRQRFGGNSCDLSSAISNR